MSRNLKTVEAEQAALAAALTTARSAAEKASIDVGDAETRVLTVSTSADAKALSTAEAALRQAEAARASARRRIELLEEAAARTADEADAIRRGDQVRALHAERAGLAARFLAAERQFAENLTSLSLALSELDATYQRSRTAARELVDLGAEPEPGDACYGPWTGSVPYAAGVDLVSASYRAAAVALSAAAPTGSPVALYVPTFPISPE